MGHEKIRLCEHLMTAYYGHDSGHIASILLNRGRLPFAHIVRLSGLPPQTVRAALVVLIHQNCVYHSFVSDPSPSSSLALSSPEHFEANPDEMLARLRFGKYVALADECFGQEGKEALECLLRESKLRMKDLEATLTDGVDPKKAKAVKSALGKLLGERFIKPCHPYSTVNPTDRHIAWEQEFAAERVKGVPSAKALKDVQSAVNDRIRAEKEEEHEEMLSFGNSRKRKAVTDHGGRASKKHAVEEQIYDDDMFVRVNYDRFNIKIRNRLLEQSCRRRFNSKKSAIVLRAMMSAVEGKQHDCSEDVSSPINVHMITQKLGDRAPELRKAFVSSAANGTWDLSVKNTGDLVEEMLLVLSRADDLDAHRRTAPTVDDYLRELNPAPIVVQSSTAAMHHAREFRIDYARYAIEMRRELVMLMVGERAGREAARLMRILMNKGKLDEKHLAKFALMPAKDVRTLCLHLLSVSLIELQEVPKTADHQPSRTFHLFFVDFRKLCAQLLEDLYKTQANLLSRKAAERKKHETLLEKSGRSDVKAQPKLLGHQERAELRRLEEKMTAMETAQLRIEADVFVLRDLPWLEG